MYILDNHLDVALAYFIMALVVFGVIVLAVMIWRELNKIAGWALVPISISMAGAVFGWADLFLLPAIFAGATGWTVPIAATCQVLVAVLAILMLAYGSKILIRDLGHRGPRQSSDGWLDADTSSGGDDLYDETYNAYRH